MNVWKTLQRTSHCLFIRITEALKKYTDISVDWKYTYFWYYLQFLVPSPPVSLYLTSINALISVNLLAVCCGADSEQCPLLRSTVTRHAEFHNTTQREKAACWPLHLFHLPFSWYPFHGFLVIYNVTTEKTDITCSWKYAIWTVVFEKTVWLRWRLQIVHLHKYFYTPFSQLVFYSIYLGGKTKYLYPHNTNNDDQTNT